MTDTHIMKTVIIWGHGCKACEQLTWKQMS